METKWVIRTEQEMKDKTFTNVYLKSFDEKTRGLSLVILIKDAKQFETKENVLEQIKDIIKCKYYHHRPFVIDEVIWI